MKMDMHSMMQKVQEVREKMDSVKNEISQKTVSADSGGGMVSVVMNGAYELTELKIEKEAVDPDDIEMLEDLIIAAVNKAAIEATEMAAAEMGKVTGMLPNIPGLNL